MGEATKRIPAHTVLKARNPARKQKDGRWLTHDIMVWDPDTGKYGKIGHIYKWGIAKHYEAHLRMPHWLSGGYVQGTGKEPAEAYRDTFRQIDFCATVTPRDAKVLQRFEHATAEWED